MGGLASSAAYLAASLTSGPPPLVAPDSVPPVATAAPSRGYVIVDLPASTAGSSLGGVLAVAIRQGGPETPVREAEASPSDAQIDADVMAAHEERIAVLQQRLVALRRDKSEGAVVHALDARLRRAEAARKLASARVALARCTGSCAIVPVGTNQPLKVASAARERREQRPARVSLVQTARTSLAAWPMAAAASPQAAVEALVPSDATQQPVGTQIDLQADLLNKARSSLGKARAVLTQAPEAEIRLAGLWQWEGSDRWSLRAGPQRGA